MTPPAASLPPPGTIDVRAVLLDASFDEASARALLPPDEILRADRILIPGRRSLFVFARAFLRRTLASSLGLPPRGIRLRADPSGKPLVESPGDRPPVHFNLSHAGDLVAVAVASDRPVGIDVERIRRIPDMDAIRERFFHPSEAAALAELPDHLAVEGFFACWTRKEACVKATGRGLAGLPDYAVRVDPRLPAAAEPAAPAAPRLSLRDFRPAPGYAGCLAAPGAGWSVRFWLPSGGVR